MADHDTPRLLTEDQVLAMPYYANSRDPTKRAARTTLFRHRKVGRLTPSGERRFLRGVRVTTGIVYREADVHAFWRDINGADENVLGTIASSPVATATINDMDAAEREMADAGYARAS